MSYDSNLNIEVTGTRYSDEYMSAQSRHAYVSAWLPDIEDASGTTIPGTVGMQPEAAEARAMNAKLRAFSLSKNIRNEVPFVAKAPPLHAHSKGGSWQVWLMRLSDGGQPTTWLARVGGVEANADGGLRLDDRVLVAFARRIGESNEEILARLERGDKLWEERKAKQEDNALRMGAEAVIRAKRAGPGDKDYQKWLDEHGETPKASVPAALESEPAPEVAEQVVEAPQEPAPEVSATVAEPPARK